MAVEELEKLDSWIARVDIQLDADARHLADLETRMSALEGTDQPTPEKRSYIRNMLRMWR